MLNDLSDEECQQKLEFLKRQSRHEKKADSCVSSFTEQEQSQYASHVTALCRVAPERDSELPSLPNLMKVVREEQEDYLRRRRGRVDRCVLCGYAAKESAQDVAAFHSCVNDGYLDEDVQVFAKWQLEQRLRNLRAVDVSTHPAMEPAVSVESSFKEKLSSLLKERKSVVLSPQLVLPKVSSFHTLPSPHALDVGDDLTFPSLRLLVDFIEVSLSASKTRRHNDQNTARVMMEILWTKNVSDAAVSVLDVIPTKATPPPTCRSLVAAYYEAQLAASVDDGSDGIHHFLVKPDYGNGKYNSLPDEPSTLELEQLTTQELTAAAAYFHIICNASSSHGTMKFPVFRVDPVAGTLLAVQWMDKAVCNHLIEQRYPTLVAKMTTALGTLKSFFASVGESAEGSRRCALWSDDSWTSSDGRSVQDLVEGMQSYAKMTPRRLGAVDPAFWMEANRIPFTFAPLVAAEREAAINRTKGEYDADVMRSGDRYANESVVLVVEKGCVVRRLKRPREEL